MPCLAALAGSADSNWRVAPTHAVHGDPHKLCVGPIWVQLVGLDEWSRLADCCTIDQIVL
jgi:hypothetical protein